MITCFRLLNQHKFQERHVAKRGFLLINHLFNPKLTQIRPVKKWAGALGKGPHPCVILDE